MENGKELEKYKYNWLKAEKEFAVSSFGTAQYCQYSPTEVHTLKDEPTLIEPIQEKLISDNLIR